MKPTVYRQRRPQRETTARLALRRILGIALIFTLLWSLWLIYRIHATSLEDHAQPADAIAVFGAAEYAGHPSPVLHARLDHVMTLYNRLIAPLIITLGGSPDGNSGRSEASVARDYLLAQGVPYDRILLDPHSTDTEQQVDRLAQIARIHNLRHLVVVSDGTHLFRIQYLCRQAGLDVYPSPRPPYGTISDYNLAQRYLHEMLSYTSLRFHLNVSRFHRWLSNQPNR